MGMFLSFDIPFFAANTLKMFQGGWFPLAVAGRAFSRDDDMEDGPRAPGSLRSPTRCSPIDSFVADIASFNPHRVRGTAVFMSSNPKGVPIVLLHHWKHNQVLPRDRRAPVRDRPSRFPKSRRTSGSTRRTWARGFTR